VEETDCKANQKKDGRVGNDLFVLPKAGSRCRAPAGTAIYIHFMVLPSLP
jgi:hypothetical protein